MVMANNKSVKSTSKSKTFIATGVVGAMVAIGAGSYGIGVATSDDLRDAPENYAITEQEYKDLTKAVSSLKIRKEDATGYSREKVGSGWRDLDGNGCDTRDDILKNSARKYARFDGCEMTSGTIYDYYNGKLLKYNKETDSGGGIQIDHIVPLANAWESGGNEWSESQWIEYYNDEAVLIPTASSTNISKGDKDITEWKPNNTNFICAYATRQIQIKTKYGLTVTSDEKAEFQRILDQECAKTD